jgi:hypothetical protein
MVGNAAAEPVTNKGFDGVGFIERHVPSALCISLNLIAVNSFKRRRA